MAHIVAGRMGWWADEQMAATNHVGGGRTLVGTDDPAGLLAAVRARAVADAATL